MQLRRDTINEGFAIEGLEAPYKAIQVFDRHFKWTMDSHAHLFYQIIYVIKGTLKIQSGQNQWTIGRGQAHVLPEGFYHSLESEGYQQLGIDLQAAQAVRNILPLYQNYIPEPTIVNCLEVMDVVSEIGDKVQIGNRVSSALVLALLDTVVLKLLEAHTRSGSERFDQRLSNFINAHLGHNICLNDVANEFHISIPHLERLAGKHFGCGVMTLFNRRRLSQACILLQSTNLPIVEIAERLGFSAQSHLSAFFRQKMGASPSAYRRFGSSAVK